MFLGGNAQFIVKSVVPDFLHIIPVGNDAMLDGILESQNSAFSLGFVPIVLEISKNP